MSMKTFKAESIFAPEITVTFAYIVFLISAFIAFKIPVTKSYLIGSFSTPPSPESYLLSLIGIVALVVSVRIGKRLDIKNKVGILTSVFVSTTLVVYLTLNIHILLAASMGVGYAGLLFYLSSQEDFKKLTKLVFLLAVAAALSILLPSILTKGTIPILNVAAREATAVSTSRALFHGLGVFASALIVGFYDKKKTLGAVAALSFLGLLSGFKSDAIAIILSASIAGLLLHRITVRAAALAAFAIGGILTGASTFIALVAHGAWNIPPYLYPFYRFGFTFSVFSKIVDAALPFGALKGGAILNTTQEIASTTILGYDKPHIITSTLFGPLTLDFGVFGTLITAVFIGIYLGAMKKDTTLRTSLYAMALTHVLILIEVGLQLSSIMFLLSMMYLSISGKQQGHVLGKTS